jgi:hypothetical protein
VKELIMRTKTMWMAVVLTLAFGFAALLRAEEAKDAKDAKKAPTQEEMMAAMMKSATPGPEHQKLKTLEGKFAADVTAIDPSGKEDKSTGTMKNEMILGGRYLKQDYSGTMMGMPFHGGGLIGYDNMKKKYTMLWVDEMSTQMMVSEGTLDESAKTITMMCTMDCPADNTKKNIKEVVTLTDEDHHTLDMYEVAADGKETKCLSIKYTRVKE